MDAQTFKSPAHEWEASSHGLVLSPSSMIEVGNDIAIKCLTLCGEETARGEYTITQRMSVSEAVRRAQFASSIQHVTRRACLKCRDLYQHGTTRYERQYLTATHPELGPIVGMDLRGKYGVPLGSVAPEEIGVTDQSSIDEFRRNHADSQARVREQIKSLRDKSGT